MGLNTFFGSLCAAVLLCPCVISQASEDGTRLLRQPSVSKDHLAFVYGGDIWVSDRDGSHPVQLTSNPAAEFAPHFSPDGKWIAFSANYDNNTDVYVIPVEGGQPRRLTWHPAADIVTGWSPDGKRLAYRPYNMAYAGPSSANLKSAPPMPTQMGK
jgi:tricorn protease